MHLNIILFHLHEVSLVAAATTEGLVDPCGCGDRSGGYVLTGVVPRVVDRGRRHPLDPLLLVAPCVNVAPIVHVQTVGADQAVLQKNSLVFVWTN